MKKVFLPAFLLISFLTGSFGQATSVKNASAIPGFRMLLTNGQYFSSAQLPKNKPFVLIYFAPDCDHCMILMDKLFKKIHQLDKASVVMISFKSPKELTGFEKNYGIARYPNIKVGTEGTTYVVRNFYRLEKTPFTAVYDKKGQLVVSYRNETR
jgi:thiol-disulfide isomerase/thioredoxin